MTEVSVEFKARLRYAMQVFQFTAHNEVNIDDIIRLNSNVTLGTPLAMSIEGETSTEKIAGTLPTIIGATVLAAYTGGAAAALLVLIGSLASNRHKNRVDNAISYLDSQIREIRSEMGELNRWAVQIYFRNRTLDSSFPR